MSLVTNPTLDPLVTELLFMGWESTNTPLEQDLVRLKYELQHGSWKLDNYLILRITPDKHRTRGVMYTAFRGAHLEAQTLYPSTIRKHILRLMNALHGDTNEETN